MKSQWINLVSQNLYSGLSDESPQCHLTCFLKLCSTIPMRPDQVDGGRLRLFSFSITGMAERWFEEQLNLTTWEDFVRRFMRKYFPPT